MLNDRTLIRDLAGLITSADYFGRDSTDRLLHYRNGVYTVDAELFLRQRVKHLLLQFGKAERWSRRWAEEVMEFILLDAPELPATPSLDWLNIENGMLHLWTGQLQPHSPQFLSTTRIPIRWDPLARCPHIDDFLAEVFPPDCLPLAWQILGDLLSPDRSIQKAICLIGEGGNGKGVFSQLATNFVGSANVSHLSLHRLETDRFSTARLYGKLANICPDLPAERLADSAVFKSLTGCDRITAERKYHDSFEFVPFARLLFSSNQFPASRDASTSYLDRWIIVPFENRFRGSRREVARRILDARLSQPQELSGALNLALPALRRIRRQGCFAETRTTLEAWRSFQYGVNSFALWLNSETVSEPTGLVSQEHLYSAYAQACLDANRAPVTKQMFGRKLKQLKPALQEVQRVLDGRKQWAYLGIRLRNAGSTAR
ncbi:MAG: phage/plasmid primase, P4 family [Acidobacteriales bacterium]|nr:phage/plasmid primase, P4 family [Terriglobales bacterium]